MKRKNRESESEGDESERVLDFTYGIGTRISECAHPLGGKKSLARQSGVSYSQLLRYASESSAPTAEPLARIAKAAGVSLDWLITGKGPRYSPAELLDREARGEEKARAVRELSLEEHLDLLRQAGQLLRDLQAEVGYKARSPWPELLQELIVAHGVPASAVRRVLETLRDDSLNAD